MAPLVASSYVTEVLRITLRTATRGACQAPESKRTASPNRTRRLADPSNTFRHLLQFAVSVVLTRRGDRHTDKAAVAKGGAAVMTRHLALGAALAAALSVTPLMTTVVVGQTNVTMAAGEEKEICTGVKAAVTPVPKSGDLRTEGDPTGGAAARIFYKAKDTANVVIEKNRLSTIAPRHDVVKRAGKLNADAAGHRESSRGGGGCQEVENAHRPLFPFSRTTTKRGPKSGTIRRPGSFAFHLP